MVANITLVFFYELDTMNSFLTQSSHWSITIDNLYVYSDNSRPYYISKDTEEQQQKFKAKKDRRYFLLIFIQSNRTAFYPSALQSINPNVSPDHVQWRLAFFFFRSVAEE